MNSKKNTRTTKKSFFVTAGIFLLGITLAIFVSNLKTPKSTEISATAATKLSFAPVASQATPLQKNPNDTFTIDVMLDPGTNAVSLVTVAIQYDSGKLQFVDNSFQPNITAFSTIVEGPVASAGSFAVQMSIGSEPTKAITSPVKVGTLTFKAIDGTGGSPTAITYTTQTAALSIAPGDTATENVISTTEPAFIAISGPSNNPTATPPNISPTDAVPTVPPVLPSPTDIVQPTTPVDSPTSIPTGVGGGNPTISLNPTSAQGGGSCNSKFKKKILTLLQKRLKQYEDRLAKLKNKKKLSSGQVKHLERKIDDQITSIKELISNVNRSCGDKKVKKHVKTALKHLLNDYKDLAKNLDAFAKGLKSHAHNKKNSGKNTAKAEANITSMSHHIQTVSQLANKTDAGIDAVTTDRQLQLAIDAVGQNAALIKTEIDKANQDMTAAVQALQ